MSQDLYQAIILEELQHPQNKKVLEDPAVTVHETNSSCGDDITVYVKFDAAGVKISDVGWQGSGCAISQAAMSLLSEKIIGIQISEVLQLQQSDLEELLGLQQPIAYGRVKCLLIGLQAVQKAVKLQL